MDPHTTRPGNVGDTLICLSVSFLKICNCCRGYSAVRKYLIIAVVCFVYLFFTVHVTRTTSRDKRPDPWTRSRVFSPNPRNTYQDPTEGEVNESLSPTRSNVVYITLKSKRHKPAILRGTVRPKPRRKKVKARPQGVTQGAANDAPRNTHTVDKHLGYSELDGIRDGDYSSIRIYSERAPPWFSAGDIAAMRFLADSKITQIDEVAPPGFSSVILFKSTANHTGDGCRKCCGIVRRPLDMSEVFAFHLDRILGLNRTLPAVSRRFHSLGGGQPCPVVLWDPSLSPIVDEPSERLNWGSYQTSLKYKCWHRGIMPKPEWRCTSIHHHEWSKLAVFDFLLQIYERLDKNCCGFKPRPEDSCVELGHHEECTDKDSIELMHIVHRRHDPHHLVFFKNKGYFDRDEENLDFRLLEGIKELPDQSVSVLRSRRLREKLLQSLFLDQQYWDSQGGRQGIEKLIDVIERRAKVLLTYINAHGIKEVPMNT